VKRNSFGETANDWEMNHKLSRARAAVAVVEVVVALGRVGEHGVVGWRRLADSWRGQRALLCGAWRDRGLHRANTAQWKLRFPPQKCPAFCTLISPLPFSAAGLQQRPVLRQAGVRWRVGGSLQLHSPEGPAGGGAGIGIGIGIGAAPGCAVTGSFPGSCNGKPVPCPSSFPPLRPSIITPPSARSQ
jgi:hypothetical protein